MGHHDYLVRTAGMQDAQAIAGITVAGWRFAYAGLIPDKVLAGLSVEARAESVRKVIAENAVDAQSDTRVICASDSGEILGVCSFGTDREDASEGEVYALYLSPTCVGQGLGKLLIQDAMARLSAVGFELVNLWGVRGQ